MRDSNARSLTSALLLGLGLALTACSSEGDDMDAMEADAGRPSEMQSPRDGESGMTTPQDESGLQAARAERERRQANVRELVTRAHAAANEGRHAEAKDLYRQALDYDPTDVEASRGYEAMVNLLAEGPQEEGPLADEVAAQQARLAKANFHYRRGLERRAEGELEGAVSDLDMAYQLLKFSPSPLQTDIDATTVKRALDDARDLLDRRERERLQSERESFEAAQRESAEREREEKQRRIRALYDRLFDLLDAEQYARAENVADEIVRLDFRDEDAKRLREQARRMRVALERRENISAIREETQRVFEQIRIDMLPPRERDLFPADWEARVADRQPKTLAADAAEISEADRAVQQALANTVLPRVDWTGKTLEEVIDELRAQTNVNIYATPEAKTAAEDAGELSLEFSQVSAEYALRTAVDSLGVTYDVRNGLVKIQTREESNRNKVVDFYNVKDLVNPIQSFPGVALNLNPSGFDPSDLDFDEPEPNQAIEMGALMDLIKNTVDRAWDEDAGNRLEPKNGTLIVRQTPEKHRRIRQLLDDLRRNTGIQVSIETRFIQIENNFLQDIGVDLRGLGDDSGGVGVAGPGTNNPFDDFGVPGQGNVGTPANPTGIGTGNDAGVFFSDRNGDTEVGARAEHLFDEVLGDPNTLDNSGGTSFQFAYLDDVQLEAILRAVQKYERINTVTAPKLMVYNTQRANLTVLNEVSYIKDYDVEIAQAAVIADPIVDKVREGVVLDVRPIVSHDRRFITLELRPNIATLVRPIRQFTTNLATGSAVTIQLPELRKQSVSTTVVVPDGGTLLLGGLKFAQEQLLDSGIPILKDIPILSFFFSRKGKSTNQRDIIILLKVEIVILEEMEPGSATASR